MLTITHKQKFTYHDHAKYITTQDVNKLTEIFAAISAQPNLASKNYIDNFAKNNNISS